MRPVNPAAAAALDQISPVARFILLPIPAILATVAPEKAREVTAVMERRSVRVLPTERAGFSFAARKGQDGAEIVVPVRGLELLWALSYTLLILRSSEASRAGAEPSGGQAVAASTAEMHTVARAVNLLASALQHVRLPLDKGRAWPVNYPKPHAAPIAPGEASSPESEADALTAYSLGWILHHELAHIDQGHLDVPTSSVQDERDADNAATEWLLAGDLTPLQRRSRLHGIALAGLTLAILDLTTTRAPGGSRATHPPTAERIFDALSHSSVPDDDPVFDFVVLGLRAFARMTGETIALSSGSNKREQAGECCAWLLRHVRVR